MMFTRNAFLITGLTIAMLAGATTSGVAAVSNASADKNDGARVAIVLQRGQTANIDAEALLSRFALDGDVDVIVRDGEQVSVAEIRARGYTHLVHIRVAPMEFVDRPGQIWMAAALPVIVFAADLVSAQFTVVEWHEPERLADTLGLSVSQHAGSVLHHLGFELGGSAGLI